MELQTIRSGIWLDSKEVSEKLGICESTLTQFLNRHPEINSDIRLIEYRKHSGRTGKKRFISQDGLIVIANIKGTSGKSIKRITPLIGKKLIAMKAMNLESQVKMQNKYIVQLQAEVIEQHSAKLREQEKKIKQIEDKIEANETLPITTGQRRFLNDRIRKFCYDNPYNNDMRVSAPVMWKKMHKKTGRRTIEEYTIQDYEIAIKWLKELYIKFELEF